MHDWIHAKCIADTIQYVTTTACGPTKTSKFIVHNQSPKQNQQNLTQAHYATQIIQESMKNEMGKTRKTKWDIGL